MEPYYVLKANEAVLRPVNENRAVIILKRIVWVVIAVFLVASYVAKESFPFSVSGETRISLIVLAVLLLFVGNKQHRVPSPFEIRFYDDYLVIYREKLYYSHKLSRLQYDKFFYKDVKRCTFKTKTQRITFYGIVEGIWYDYNKDGTVQKEPSYHKTTDSLDYFYTSASDVDFVREIEEHSPIKVEIENT